MNEQDYEQLTLFPGDSLVSLLVWPGSAEAIKMTVTSGRKCLELSRSCGPLGLLEKMLLESSIWRSTQCYLTWKPKATPQGRLLFQLAVSVPHTGDIDARLWPTVRAKETGDYQYSQGRHDKKTLTLTGAAKMWPTPKASDCTGTGPVGSKSAEHDRKHGNLKGVVMYPTPTGARLCGGAHAAQALDKLQEAEEITSEEKKSMKNGNGGQLNPMWVEWLMGFPIGWTDLNASETL